MSQPPEKPGGQLRSAYHYRCDSGETIAVTYPSDDSASVVHQGNNYDMQIVVSASGSRYLVGRLEWWTKGSGPESEGTLFRAEADGNARDIIERCTFYSLSEG